MHEGTYLVSPYLLAVVEEGAVLSSVWSVGIKVALLVDVDEVDPLNSAEKVIRMINDQL